MTDANAIPQRRRWLRWTRGDGRPESNLAGYTFLLPWFIGFIGLTVGPALASLYFSFTDYDLLQPAKWVGSQNYINILTDDPDFADAMRVTAIYVLLSVPLKLIFALAVAFLMNEGLKGLPIYRALFYLPSLVGGSVAVSVLWRQLFSSNGLVNHLLSVFGIVGPSWISDPQYALETLVVLSVWQFGAPMIIFLAGLRQIPTDYYEAASLDGAGPWRQFFRITLPLLTPVIFFNFVVQTIDAFKAFTPAYIISEGSGGPINSTMFYTLYLYQQGFTFFQMGYASALAWLLVIMTGLFTAFAFLTSKYWVHYND